MAKDKAIYAPGELGRVRQNLGNLDPNEAKRIAEMLGGEVGVERSAVPEKTGPIAKRHPSGKAQPMRRVEILDPPVPETDSAGKDKKGNPKLKKLIPEDNPAVPIHQSYFERLKMDRYAAETTFEIKSILQVTASFFAFFKRNEDYVNPGFVTNRLDEYYKKLEVLVNSTRTMFPRNNLKNNEQLKKMSPFLFSILDTIRNWNIERVSSDMAKMQARSKMVKVSDFTEILRAVYKPLFILEQLDVDLHIKGAYKLLYKVLYLDDPMEAKEKYQETIRTTLVSYDAVNKDLHFLLYPLLLKLLSSNWLPYQRFFMERRHRLMEFLNVTEKDRIDPESLFQKPEEGQTEEEKKPEEEAKTPEEEDPQAAARHAANQAERKAVERGLRTLESLFPQAGWDRLDTFPDLYVYFAKVLDLKNGYELIAPSDPLLQTSILMRIVEELLFGLRFVNFEIIEGVDAHLDEIINQWRDYEMHFTQEYLTRLREYCQILETSSADAKGSSYAKRIHNELQWIKRLGYLPHYQFSSVGGSPFKKNNIIPLYPEVRRLRKYLTVVAAGIEQAGKAGGSEKQAPCRGIANPWANYNFQIANPLSMRLNSLLAPSKRHNASLVYFTLSVVTVLDYFINNEESWAYENSNSPLFRSKDGAGIIPQFGVDEKIDADSLFKQVMKDRQKEKQEKKAQQQQPPAPPPPANPEPPASSS
ncbi:MAG: hypothetical protein LBG90_05615 [Spirochaetaceae bacterium]|jgi:hypothetical protein|nr:hypothetical protein [Spirochaetaceae bacterium]